MEDTAELVRWLKAKGQMIATTLDTWTVNDLAETYRHVLQQHIRANSRQWTIWRILSHDVHHGGQLALLLDPPRVSALPSWLTARAG